MADRSEAAMIDPVRARVGSRRPARPATAAGAGSYQRSGVGGLGLGQVRVHSGRVSGLGV